MDMRLEVKPCPCCGSKDIYAGVESASSYHAKCNDCGMRTRPVGVINWPKNLEKEVFDILGQGVEYEKAVMFVCIRECLKSWNFRA
jgi:hypothetical protein